MIYFIQELGTGNIKIGHGGEPLERMRLFQTGNSQELKLLVAMPGRKDLESRLHQRFAHACVRGEWFRPTAELLAFVADVVRVQEEDQDQRGAIRRQLSTQEEAPLF